MRENQLEITRQGKELLAKALSGERLEFTVATLSDRRNPRRGINVPIATVAATNNSIDLSVKVDNSDSFQAIEIESIAIYARIKGWLTSEEKFAEVRFDHPDFLLPKNDGYDELEYTFVFAIDTDHRGAGGINVQVKRTYELSRNEIQQIAHDEAVDYGKFIENRIEREFIDSLERDIKRLRRQMRRSGPTRREERALKEIDNIEYHLFTDLNALAMLSPPATRQVTRRVEKWLNDDRARRRDWKQYKRMINRKAIYALTNKLRSFFTRSTRYSGNRTLEFVGRFFLVLPALWVFVGIPAFVIAIIVGIASAIPAVLSWLAFVIVGMIAFAVMAIIHAICFVIEVIYVAVTLVLEIIVSIINGLIILSPLAFIAVFVSLNLFTQFIPMLVQIVWVATAAVLLIIAAILFIPTLAVGSLICLFVILAVLAIAVILVTISVIISVVLYIVFLPLVILQTIWAVITFIWAAVLVIISAIVVAFFVVVLFILSISVVVFVDSLIVIASFIIAAPLALFSLPIGLFFIYRSKAQRGNIISHRNIKRFDRMTRKLNRRRRV